MPPRLPRKVKEHLKKARESCLAAVAHYNNPTVEFRSGTYITLMVIAWTSLFHAIFYQRGEKPWVGSGTGRGRRYVWIGSEPKHWGLLDCLRKFYEGETTAVRKNLELLVGLRDRIEHRDMPELDHEIFGQCQAALLNFERLLAERFDAKHALNMSLVFSLQLSGLVPEAREAAMERLRRSATDSVVTYVRQFGNELAPEIASDQQFAFKVFLVPQLANHRSADTLAVDFVPFDPQDPAQMDQYNKTVVLMKQRVTEVRNYGKYLRDDVVAAVVNRLFWNFNGWHHTQCWKFFKVRPPGGASNPSKCDIRYCQWDSTFRQYVYTDDWIDMLVSELEDKDRFIEIIGKEPVAKVAEE